MMGRIQTLDIRAQPFEKSVHLLDKFGAFQELDTPFNTFGFPPTLVDAPALDVAPGSTSTWRADSYLTVCTDIALTHRVEHVGGFRCGFWC
jgi:hypothetical protein